MADFKGVIRLTRTQFNTLKTSGTLTVGGQTLTYDPINTYYLCTTKDEMYLDDYVDLFTDQEISGVKKFKSTVWFPEVDGGCINFRNSFFINGLSGAGTLIGADGTASYVGVRNRPIKLRGTGDRPLYNDKALALKSDVDTLDGLVVHIAGDETITGKKTFSSEITGSSGASITGKTNITGDTAITGAMTVSKDTTISGNLTIAGHITQNGSTYETHAEQVYSTKDYIYLREGATGSLTEGTYTGLEFIKYDGTNNGRLVVDMNGVARVGDVGDEQPLATREETPISTAVAYWSTSDNKFITNTNIKVLGNHLYSNGKQVVNLSDSQILTNKTLGSKTKVGANILPEEKDTYNLGSPEAKFNYIYATYFTGAMSAALTLQSSASDTIKYDGSEARELSKMYMDLFTEQSAAGNKTFTGTTKAATLHPVTSDSSVLGDKSGQRFKQVVANEHVITENGSATGWKLSTDSDGTLNFVFE